MNTTGIHLAIFIFYDRPSYKFKNLPRNFTPFLITIKAIFLPEQQDLHCHFPKISHNLGIPLDGHDGPSNRLDHQMGS